MNPGFVNFTNAGSTVRLEIKLVVTANTTILPKLLSDTILLEISTLKPQEIAKKLKNRARPVVWKNSGYI